MRIAIPLVPAIAAAPVLTALLQKLIAGSRAVPPASIMFECTSKTSGREKGSAVESEVRIDRWHGRQMARISTNGRPATPEEIEKVRKATTTIAGYRRIADYLVAGARRSDEASGQIVYHLDRLPKDMINMGGDRSDRFLGDLSVDISGARAFIVRTNFYAPAFFSILFVAKVDRFDAVSDYRNGADGSPALDRQVQTIAGAQFGKAGETRTESPHSPLRRSQPCPVLARNRPCNATVTCMLQLRSL